MTYLLFIVYCWIAFAVLTIFWKGDTKMATKKREHPDGRYYGETKKEFRARLQGRDTRPVLERKMLADRFNADVKSMGLTAAMAAHGIEEDAA